MIVQDKQYYSNYRNENRIWLREYKRNWHHKTKEQRKADIHSYYIANRDHIRQRHKKNNIKRRIEILSMLGSKCVKCSFSSDYRALQIDHVKGNGYIERKTQSHSWGYAFWKKALAERPLDYQILCANCNWIKRIENKEIWNDKKVGSSL